MPEVGGGRTGVSQLQAGVSPLHKILHVVGIKANGFGQQRQGSSILLVVEGIIHCSVAVGRTQRMDRSHITSGKGTFAYHLK